ncbi:TerD family protein [Nocardia sp. NPDC059177]|uniref:TerD family protein n=1 Tax=Nocardia sp. NPDC059177 TaxID=3346759 RepID=UPI003695A91D
MSATLVKGQNGPIRGGEVVVSVRVGAPVSTAALLVTEQGRVRSDSDLVCDYQPFAPGVRLQAGTVAVSLAQVPADIAQVRTVIVLDSPAGGFGRIAPPSVVVAEDGRPVYEFRIDGLSSESAVLAVELYRRQGGWKVRAVGSGYAGGFGALAADHGARLIEVPRPAPTPSPSSWPSSSSTSSPPTPGREPTLSQPPTPGWESTPSWPPTPSREPAPSRPPIPSSGPGAWPGSAPVPGAGSAPPPGLSRRRPVSLAKGQRVTLRKDGGAALTFVRMGLGWDPVTRGRLFGRRPIEIDLDASVAMFADHTLVDLVCFGQLISDDGAIRHQGDNLTGEGDGDDEVILVDLVRVPAHITTLLFFVTSYQGHTFQQVTNAFCRLVDNTTGAELARYALTGGMPYTAIAMAKVSRAAGEWTMQALGDPFHARTPGDAIPQLGRFLTGR